MLFIGDSGHRTAGDAGQVRHAAGLRRPSGTAGRAPIAVLPDYSVDVLGDRLYMIAAPNLYPAQAIRTLIDFLKSRVKIAGK